MDPCFLQMVSLLHLAEIKEEGVTFQSPVDGSSMLLTPEHSMAIQNRLGGTPPPSLLCPLQTSCPGGEGEGGGDYDHRLQAVARSRSDSDDVMT